MGDLVDRLQLLAHHCAGDPTCPELRTRELQRFEETFIHTSSFPKQATVYFQHLVRLVCLALSTQLRLVPSTLAQLTRCRNEHLSYLLYSINSTYLVGGALISSPQPQIRRRPSYSPWPRMRHPKIDGLNNRPSQTSQKPNSPQYHTVSTRLLCTLVRSAN